MVSYFLLEMPFPMVKPKKDQQQKREDWDCKITKPSEFGGVFFSVFWGVSVIYKPSESSSLPDDTSRRDKLRWRKRCTTFGTRRCWRKVDVGTLKSGWNLRIHPWKWKIIWTKPSFSGSMLILGGVLGNSIPPYLCFKDMLRIRCCDILWVYLRVICR